MLKRGIKPRTHLHKGWGGAGVGVGVEGGGQPFGTGQMLK